MNIQLSDIIWFGLLASLAALWWHGQGIKAAALVHVKKYCEHYDIQLLDESLVLRKLWLSRNKEGVVRIQRTYFFEFTSTGEYRYRGTITLLGYKLQGVDAQTHHLQ